MFRVDLVQRFSQLLQKNNNHMYSIRAAKMPNDSNLKTSAVKTMAFD